MKKKVLSIALALCLVLAVLPGVALATKTVAQIDQTTYATLDAAITAVSDEQTIELLENITLTAPVAINKAVAIEGNGKTITGPRNSSNTDADAAFLVTDDFYLSNAIVTGCGIGVRIKGENNNVVIDNCEITAGHYAVALRNIGQNVTITNSTLSGWAGVMTSAGDIGLKEDTNSIITLTGTTINATNRSAENYGAIVLQDRYHGVTLNVVNCEINLTEGSASAADFSALDIRAYGSEINISDLKINSNDIGIASGRGLICLSRYSTETSTENAPTIVDAVGVTLPTDTYNTTYFKYKTEDVRYGDIVVINGVRYFAGSDGIGATPAASIGTVVYATLQEAVSAAGSGDTVKILKDLTLTKQVTIKNSGITLDGQGKTITADITYGAGEDGPNDGAGIMIYPGASDVTIKNLKIIGQNTHAGDWDSGECGIKAFDAERIVIQDVKVTGANTGIQVNGASVTFKGTVDLSGNEHGGVEVGKGAGAAGDLTNPGRLTIDPSCTLIDTSVDLPTIWADYKEADDVAAWGIITGGDLVKQFKLKVETHCDNYYVSSDHVALINNVKYLDFDSAAHYCGDKGKLSTGGYFTIDPSAYVADGFIAVANTTVPGYYFTIEEKSETAAVVVEGAATAAPGADIPDDQIEEASALAGAINNPATAPKTEGLGIAANSYAQNNTTLPDEELAEDLDAELEDIAIVYQPYLNIEINGLNTGAESGEAILSLDISAQYVVLATTADLAEGEEVKLGSNAVQIGTPQPMQVTSPVTIRIPLTEDLYNALEGKTIYVEHESSSGTYFYAGTLGGTATEDPTLTITTRYGFSPFRVLVDTRTATVDFLNEAGTLMLTKEFTLADVNTLLPTATKAGNNFSGWRFYSSDEIDFFPEAAPFKTFTEELLEALNDQEVTARPVFTPMSGGASDPEPKRPFTDVAENQWFYDAVYYCYDNKVMEGISATLFAPDSNLNRGMMVQILYNMENKPAVSGASTFTDVADNAWYADAVKWAASKGIVNGYGGGLYGPEDNVTREQMAKILNGYAAFKGYDVTASKDLTSFPDGNTVSEYALPMVRWAYATGLLTGRTNGLLDPQGNASRAEVATVMMRFMETIAK